MASQDPATDQTQKPVAEPLDCTLADVRIGKPDTGKTVGDHLRLRCEGNLGDPIASNAVIFMNVDGEKPEAPEKDAFGLYLLAVEKSEVAELVALVTSYKPGPFDNPEVFLQSGEKLYQLNGLSWNFESVLPEAEKLQKETIEPPPEQLEPFPFIGPIGISYPIWIWFAVAFILIIPSLFIFRLLRKRGQKKKLMAAALSGMGPAGTPIQEFSKIQRQVHRSLDNPGLQAQKSLESLDVGFRNYLVKRCLVPAFDWTEAEILKDIKKHYPKAYSGAGRDVLKVLREFNRIKNKEVKPDDLEQLMEQSRRVVEKLEALL